jgi:hypothetical protein
MAKGGKLVMDGAIISGDPNMKEIVYCYTFPSRRDRIKIGYSSRGLRRIVEQSTGFPENPEVLFVIHHENAAQIEKDFHVSLADKQAAVLGREWFGAKMSDVLAVSPLLRKASQKQRWRSLPRLFASGALFGLGLFTMPLLALAVLELSGAGANIMSAAIAKDYLAAAISRNVAAYDIALSILRYLRASSLSTWAVGIVIASPAIMAGLAYLSFRKQVA